MPVRFKINVEKCIEGIDLLAHRKPGITQYYVCKIFYFADKEYLLDWGRPISGDRFVALEHGPVPSFIYDLLKDASGEPDEIIDMLNERVEITRPDNKLRIYSKGRNNFPHLSGAELEYLEGALKKYGHLSFSQLKAISHADPAYEQASTLPGNNNEMDISLWFSDVRTDGQPVLQRLEEMARLSHHIVN